MFVTGGIEMIKCDPMLYMSALEAYLPPTCRLLFLLETFFFFFLTKANTACNPDGRSRQTSPQVISKPAQYRLALARDKLPTGTQRLM